MNIVADESVDGPIVLQLRSDGHTIIYIAELEPGIPDEKVLELANANGAILLTADTDFGELVFRQRKSNSGVVLLRLSGLTSTVKARIASIAIREHDNEFAHAFAVISPDTIRIRNQSE